MAFLHLFFLPIIAFASKTSINQSNLPLANSFYDHLSYEAPLNQRPQSEKSIVGKYLAVDTVTILDYLDVEG